MILSVVAGMIYDRKTRSMLSDFNFALEGR